MSYPPADFLRLSRASRGKPPSGSRAGCRLYGKGGCPATYSRMHRGPFAREGDRAMLASPSVSEAGFRLGIVSARKICKDSPQWGHGIGADTERGGGLSGLPPHYSSSGLRAGRSWRRGKQTRYREEGVSYLKSQANSLPTTCLYGISGEVAPSGPRGGSRIETAGVAPGPRTQPRHDRQGGLGAGLRRTNLVSSLSITP